VDWTDEAVETLKSEGFNAIQINIAWSSRPYDNPLNLIDVVTVPGESELPGTAQRRAEMKRRVAMTLAHGLRPFFHVGSPYMDRNPYTGEVRRISYHVDNKTFDSWYDVNNPKVRDHETALLKEFRRQFPEIRDLLIYTYDQDAWQTPEYTYNKYSYGIPLASRIASYLTALQQAWTSGRSGQARLWWEPWELSAGEVYAALPKLPRTDFGLMLHSTIAEDQLAMPVDVWFRNVARMSQSLGIPVVAEGLFASTPQEVDPLMIPSPRLVDEQYLAFMGVPGVVGIKEYFGINVPVHDFDIDVLKARIQNPSRSTQELIDAVTARYGDLAPDVRKYLGLLSDAVQVFPWDASPRTLGMGGATPDHGWSGATIRGFPFLGRQPFTPAWESTRYAHYMVLDDKAQPHFWMLEDMELRCKLTADLLDQASQIGERLVHKLPEREDRDQFTQIQHDIDIIERVSRSYALHLRETNVAQMLRQDLEAGRPLTAALAQELGDLLEADVANQHEKGRVVEMRRLYRDDPKAFVQSYLVPNTEETDQQSFRENPQNITTR
jgi:hypothetical protein